MIIMIMVTSPAGGMMVDGCNAACDWGLTV